MSPIVGIGELLWDIYPDGRKVAGGAPFNFAFHCHRLGHEAVIVSRVGDDDLGRELREEVKRLGMSDEFIQRDGEHPTGTVEIALDGNGVPSYRIAEDVAWDHLECTPATETLRRVMRACCYGSLTARSAASREMVARFRSIWDKGDNEELLVCDINIRHRLANQQKEDLFDCDWLKFNEEELLMLIPEAQSDDYGYFINHTFPTWTVILTLGPRGFLIVSHGDEFTENAAPANVIDTVGAGDAFTAAMVVMHLEGRPLRECARFANHYAARVCEHRGATPKIDRRDVELAAFGR